MKAVPFSHGDGVYMVVVHCCFPFGTSSFFFMTYISKKPGIETLIVVNTNNDLK